MVQEGFLLIADITGYTGYLSASELEHAQESLSNLLKLLIDRTRPPQIISRLEGDAIISYVRMGSLGQGQTLVETTETSYVAFHAVLEDMIRNTNCPCSACRNLPNLDLKFFIHFGQFSTQKLGAHTELIGSDVNLVHRLTKNHIPQATGIKAYAAYTQAAVDALEIHELAAGFIRHEEEYEHLGRVTVYVQDMRPVWQEERERRRVVVTPEEAILTLSYDYPVSQIHLWEVMTDAKTRTIAFGTIPQVLVGRRGGRTGPGASYHCYHGDKLIRLLIVDWQPFEQITCDEDSPVPKVRALATYRLTPIEGGTRLTIHVARAHGAWPLVKAGDFMTRRLMAGHKLKSLKNLADYLQAEAGQEPADEAAALPAEAVQAAVREELAAG